MACYQYQFMNLGEPEDKARQATYGPRAVVYPCLNYNKHC